VNVLNKIGFNWEMGVLITLPFLFFSIIMVLLYLPAMNLGIAICALAFGLGGIQIKNKGEL